MPGNHHFYYLLRHSVLCATLVDAHENWDLRICADLAALLDHAAFAYQTSFFGNNENAVKTQIWCAISTYVLITIIKKELQFECISLHFITDFIGLYF